MTGSAGRRAFLRGALVSGAAGLAAGGASPAGPRGPRPHPVPFHGEHQAGVLETPRRRTSVTSFDVIADGRAELTELFRALTDRARALTGGGAADGVGISGPPPDSGVLGPDVPGGGLLVTVGVGASLFDGRYDLAGRRPPGLRRMRTFPGDALEEAWCHGDLSLQLSADDDDTVVHALRDIARHTRGAMQVRWRIGGFTSPPRPGGTPRNLMGFKDGIANPRPEEFDRLVWLREPSWAAGGTYVVFRLIRMLVEFWDRISIGEQEAIFGRSRDSGAPLDGTHESDEPQYARDPIGKIIPLTSHIRLSNPRTPQTAGSRVLRRSFNYDRGVDAAGDLDMGLIFSCYQGDVAAQFEAVQTRLADEPLTDYITPFGGGYFLVLPGVRDGGDFLGRALVS